MSKQRANNAGTQMLGTVEEVAARWGVTKRLAEASPLGKAYETCLACSVEANPRSKVQAGSANTELRKITLNLALLEPGREADRNATLLHECAHILADLAHRRNCRHGKRWKEVMELLGEEPAVNHDLAYLSPKLHARVTWVCKACGEEYHYVRGPRRRPQDCYCVRCGPRRGRLRVRKEAYQLELDLPVVPAP
jgi:predicted SprT family Zn-dependent metalloprotease